MAPKGWDGRTHDAQGAGKWGMGAARIIFMGAVGLQLLFRLVDWRMQIHGHGRQITSRRAMAEEQDWLTGALPGTGLAVSGGVSGGGR